jgi:hypothetical protein
MTVTQKAIWTAGELSLKRDKQHRRCHQRLAENRRSRLDIIADRDHIGNGSGHAKARQAAKSLKAGRKRVWVTAKAGFNCVRC